MATRWGRLAGDTATFAVKIVFMDDPDCGQGMDIDSVRSWGGFQIWSRGTNLCSHLELGERVEYAYWYLLPLMEWFVHNWSPLLHEERLPCGSTDTSGWRALRSTLFPPQAATCDQETRRENEWHGWWSRHAISAAREGGLFPDLVIRRVRDAVEISCGPARRAGVPDHVVFQSEHAQARFAPRDVAEPLYEVLESAASYLAQVAPTSERLRQLAKSTRRLRTRHRERRLQWLAGLGSDEESIEKRWKWCKRQLTCIIARPQLGTLLATTGDSQLVVEGSCHAALMFGSVSPTVHRDDVIALASWIADLTDFEQPCDSMASYCRDEPVDEYGGASWLQGYDLADEFHESPIGAPLQGDFVDVEAILSELHVDVMEVALRDQAIRGVAIAGPHHRAGIGWNPNNHFNASTQGKRFTLAHELCHLLFDRKAGQRLAVASGPWAPQQIEQRANAFAAMLLMPTALVRQASPARISTEGEVARVANQLQVGFAAALWHMRNLGFVDDVVRQRIEHERESRHVAIEAAQAP